jgi:hypothetical protein
MIVDTGLGDRMKGGRVMRGHIARAFAYPLGLALMCVPVSAAFAQSAKVDQLRALLAKIVADHNSKATPRETQTGNGEVLVRSSMIDIQIGRDGLIVWKHALNTCLQVAVQAKLSDLDLQKSSVKELTDPAEHVRLDIPCKSGNCVKDEMGDQVWPSIGGTATCPSHAMREKATFAPPPFQGTYRSELVTILKR